MYDAPYYGESTGLIFKSNRYFDPTLGIWLSLAPLVVLQGGKGRKRRKHQWSVLLVILAGVGGMMVGCSVEERVKEGDLTQICTQMPIPTQGSTQSPTKLPLVANFTLLAGSNVKTCSDVDQRINEANQIFSQPIALKPGENDPPRIQVVRGTVKSMDDAQTRQVLGGDLEFHPLEEGGYLYPYNRNGADLTVYYVQETYVWEEGGFNLLGIYGASVIIENKATERTLAHEIGHALDVNHLGDEDRVGIKHGVSRQDYSDNLMLEGGGTGKKLSLIQLERLADGYYHSEKLYPTPTPSFP